MTTVGFPADTVLHTKDGTKTIKEIVDKRYKGPILSYDINQNKTKYVVIDDWFMNEAETEFPRQSNWLKIKTDTGSLVCTAKQELLWIYEGDGQIFTFFFPVENNFHKHVGKHLLFLTIEQCYNNTAEGPREYYCDAVAISTTMVVGIEEIDMMQPSYGIFVEDNNPFVVNGMVVSDPRRRAVLYDTVTLSIP